MRYTVQTDYALISLCYMVKKGGISPITIRQIAKDEKYTVPFVEKIFQKLRRAGIVKSIKGTAGGYILAKEPSKITLKMVIESVEGTTFDMFCTPLIRKSMICTHLSDCGLKPVWAKTRHLLDELYASISIATIAKSEMEVEALVA